MQGVPALKAQLAEAGVAIRTGEADGSRREIHSVGAVADRNAFSASRADQVLSKAIDTEELGHHLSISSIRLVVSINASPGVLSLPGSRNYPRSNLLRRICVPEAFGSSFAAWPQPG